MSGEQTNLSTPVGRGKFGSSVTLPLNGNVVVTDPEFNPPSESARREEVAVGDGTSWNYGYNLRGEISSAANVSQVLKRNKATQESKCKHALPRAFAEWLESVERCTLTPIPPIP